MCNQTFDLAYTGGDGVDVTFRMKKDYSQTQVKQNVPGLGFVRVRGE